MKAVFVASAVWLIPVASHAQAASDSTLANAATAPLPPGCKYTANSNRTPSGSGPALFCSVAWGTTQTLANLVSQGIYLEVATPACVPGSVANFVGQNLSFHAGTSESGHGGSAMMKVDGAPAGCTLNMDLENISFDGAYPTISDNGMEAGRFVVTGNVIQRNVWVHDLGGRPFTYGWTRSLSGIFEDTETIKVHNACDGYAQTQQGDHCEYIEDVLSANVAPTHVTEIYRDINVAQDNSPYQAWTAAIWLLGLQIDHLTIDGVTVSPNEATNTSIPGFGRIVGLGSAKIGDGIIANVNAQCRWSYFGIYKENATISGTMLFYNNVLSGQAVSGFDGYPLPEPCGK